jgi:hypothetical protein
MGSPAVSAVMPGPLAKGAACLHELCSPGNPDDLGSPGNPVDLGSPGNPNDCGASISIQGLSLTPETSPQSPHLS